MVKGSQKQMIVVKTAESDVFEEAYFVVRRNATAGRMDMLAEANKIIDSCGVKGKKRPKIDTKLLAIMLCSFVGGGAVGAMAVGFFNFFA